MFYYPTLAKLCIHSPRKLQVIDKNIDWSRAMSGHTTVDGIQLFHAFAGNSQNYLQWCCGKPGALSPEAARPRAIVDWVVRNTEGDRIDCCLF